MPTNRRLIAACLCAALSAACAASSLAQQPAAGAAPAAKPGTPKSARWQVSWAVDPDIAKVKGSPKPTTIEQLITYKRPKDLPLVGTAPEWYRTHRLDPIETTLWKITATIVNVASERDGDYRLTVADEKGNRIICVMPDPKLAPKRSRLSKLIDEVRATVLKRFDPTLDGEDVEVKAEIVGTGYFGRYNAEENPSPEGFQLHPIFRLRLLED